MVADCATVDSGVIGACDTGCATVVSCECYVG